MCNEVIVMNIVWIGCHEEGILAFKQTLKNSKNISAFITLNEGAFSKRSAGSREYEEYCNKYNVKYYTVSTIKGEEAYEIILKHKPDLLVVLGWSEILPARLLEIPTIGTVGTHAALLPHNRGSAPINWAIINGEKVTGNTMMWLDPQVDAGAIVDQIEFAITPYDTCKTLYDQVAISNETMLMRLIENLEKGIKRPVLSIANETDEPILPRRKPKDGLLNWNQSGEAIYDFIRALTDPYPGAFTFLNGKKYFIWKAALFPMPALVSAGEIAGSTYGFADNSCGFVVGTETNAVLITEIEDETGKRYSGKDLNDLNLRGKFKNE